MPRNTSANPFPSSRLPIRSLLIRCVTSSAMSTIVWGWRRSMLSSTLTNLQANEPNYSLLRA